MKGKGKAKVHIFERRHKIQVHWSQQKNLAVETPLHQQNEFFKLKTKTFDLKKLEEQQSLK